MSRLRDSIIGAEIASGDLKGNHVYIPQIPLESSYKHKLPIAFKRMQFPVISYFVITINKAQGQTLDFSGVYLRKSVSCMDNCMLHCQGLGQQRQLKYRSTIMSKSFKPRVYKKYSLQRNLQSRSL